MTDTLTLYHGTTPEAAEALALNGWRPNVAAPGANQGQSRYLYLSTHYEDALWFAEQKGSDVVVRLENVPVGMLAVDPEDGTGDTVEAEISSPHGLPGKLVLTRPLAAEHFTVCPKANTTAAP